MAVVTDDVTKVWLRDSHFTGQACVHASGDSAGRRPARITFNRITGEAPREVRQFLSEQPWIWLTDAHLSEAGVWREAGFKVCGWVLEPRTFRSSAHECVERTGADFDAVLTYDAGLLSWLGLRGRWYPFGGTRVHPSDWRLDEKQAGISIVASEKRGTPNQALRHRVIQHFGERIHAFGPWYRPLARKVDALAYQFHIAIEAVSEPGFFSEALIDPLLTGTVPIYMGVDRETLANLALEPKGIACATDEDSLIAVIESILEEPEESYLVYSGEMYDQERLTTNFVRAHDYTMPEDWIARSYPELLQ